MAEIPQEAVFSVAEFLDFTNEMLKPLKFTVQGEITSVSHRATATYFSLNDKNEKAKLDCVVWHYRLKSLGFDLEEGQEVQVVGSPNIYKPFGKFSLMVEHASPVGEGALAQAFEKLKRQLEELGFFRPENKKNLPTYPQRIGVITSEFGDAIKDFQTHLGSHGFSVELFDVRVEGLQAIDSLARAIRWFNEQPNPVEVLVVTRGGGSLESLQAFNSEIVAKAIFASKIPVISAIGHENDVTIADLVADVRASTPTHAGKILAESWLRIEDTLRAYDESFTSQFQQRLEREKNKISNLQLVLLSYVGNFFERFRLIEKTFAANLPLWQRSHSQILQTTRASESILLTGFQHTLKNWQGSLLNLELQLQAHDPKQKLKQGYSIVTNAAGKVVRSKGQIHHGDEIKIQMFDALVHSTVEAVE